MTTRQYKLMNFTTTKLKLPLFMLSRQKLKGNKILKAQFAKQGESYTRGCVPENADDERETATISYLRHIAGRHRTSLPVKSRPCPKKPLNVKRDQMKRVFVGLPPNLYDTTKIPYLSRKGFGVKMIKKSIPKYKLQPELEETYQKSPVEPEKKQEQVLEMRKGTFDFNAREAPPTSRFMALNKKDIVGPPPNKYDIVERKCVKYNPQDQTKFQFAKAYKFYPNTKVMVTDTYLTDVTKNQSFRPGPGRYPQHYGCFCKRILNRIYEPKLPDLIIKAKALKALHQPHKKINPQDYFCPLFQHVKGHGHTHLFKNFTPAPPLTAEEKQRIKKNVGEGPARAYINKILNPKRETISLFPHKGQIKTTIEYNSLMRFKKRKTGNTKKLGFLSSAPRFKEDESFSAIKHKQALDIRPMPDFPITNIPLDQIKGRLYDDYLENAALPTAYSSAKRPFHFKPLPEAKMLVTPEDYIPVLKETRGFYTKKYKHENFFWGASSSEESVVLNRDIGV